MYFFKSRILVIYFIQCDIKWHALLGPDMIFPEGTWAGAATCLTAPGCKDNVAERRSPRREITCYAFFFFCLSAVSKTAPCHNNAAIASVVRKVRRRRQNAAKGANSPLSSTSFVRPCPLWPAAGDYTNMIDQTIPHRSRGVRSAYMRTVRVGDEIAGWGQTVVSPAERAFDLHIYRAVSAVHPHSSSHGVTESSHWFSSGRPRH